MSCGHGSADREQDTIIALERGALARWGKGDPQGFLEIMAAEQTYFDPQTDKRVDGQEALKKYFAPFVGKISIERGDMIDPKVQRVGDMAVLTFNLNDYGGQFAGGPKTTTHWNATEVYRQINGAWKIVHSHWSYVKPDVTETAEAREADASEMRDAEAEWVKAWAARDIDRVVNHYADDAFVELAGVPIMRGKKEIRDGLKQGLSDPAFSLSFAPVQIEVSKSGDLAYARGTYTVTKTERSTVVTNGRGKYIVVYRKQADGRWKAIHDINNNDAPAVVAKR